MTTTLAEATIFQFLLKYLSGQKSLNFCVIKTYSNIALAQIEWADLPTQNICA